MWWKRKKKKSSGITKKYVSTFTKKWVSRLLWCGIIWISLSYILAFLDKPAIAESLSQTVATVIIATILGYLAKAFFETKEEKKNELLQNNLDQSDASDDENIGG